jgi:hypothetical protein
MYVVHVYLQKCHLHNYYLNSPCMQIVIIVTLVEATFTINACMQLAS